MIIYASGGQARRVGANLHNLKREVTMKLGKLDIRRQEPIGEYDNVMPGWYVWWGWKLLFRRIDRIGKWERAK
jgi:hypothetical protein